MQTFKDYLQAYAAVKAYYENRDVENNAQTLALLKELDAAHRDLLRALGPISRKMQ